MARIKKNAWRGKRHIQHVHNNSAGLLKSKRQNIGTDKTQKKKKRRKKKRRKNIHRHRRGN